MSRSYRDAAGAPTTWKADHPYTWGAGRNREKSSEFLKKDNSTIGARFVSNVTSFFSGKSSGFDESKQIRKIEEILGLDPLVLSPIDVALDFFEDYVEKEDGFTSALFKRCVQAAWSQSSVKSESAIFVLALWVTCLKEQAQDLEDLLKTAVALPSKSMSDDEKLGWCRNLLGKADFVCKCNHEGARALHVMLAEFMYARTTAIQTLRLLLASSLVGDRAALDSSNVDVIFSPDGMFSSDVFGTLLRFLCKSSPSIGLGQLARVIKARSNLSGEVLMNWASQTILMGLPSPALHDDADNAEVVLNYFQSQLQSKLGKFPSKVFQILFYCMNIIHPNPTLWTRDVNFDAFFEFCWESKSKNAAMDATRQIVVHLGGWDFVFRNICSISAATFLLLESSTKIEALPKCPPRILVRLLPTCKSLKVFPESNRLHLVMAAFVDKSQFSTFVQELVNRGNELKDRFRLLLLFSRGSNVGDVVNDAAALNDLTRRLQVEIGNRSSREWIEFLREVDDELHPKPSSKSVLNPLLDALISGVVRLEKSDSNSSWLSVLNEKCVNGLSHRVQKVLLQEIGKEIQYDPCRFKRAVDVFRNTQTRDWPSEWVNAATAQRSLINEITRNQASVSKLLNYDDADISDYCLILGPKQKQDDLEVLSNFRVQAQSLKSELEDLRRTISKIVERVPNVAPLLNSFPVDFDAEDRLTSLAMRVADLNKELYGEERSYIVKIVKGLLIEDRFSKVFVAFLSEVGNDASTFPIAVVLCESKVRDVFGNPNATLKQMQEIEMHRLKFANSLEKEIKWLGEIFENWHPTSAKMLDDAGRLSHFAFTQWPKVHPVLKKAECTKGRWGEICTIDDEVLKQIKNDEFKISSASNVVQSLEGLFPSFSITSDVLILMAKGREARLETFLFENLGSDEDFARFIPMLRGNSQDDEMAMELINSLPTCREAYQKCAAGETASFPSWIRDLNDFIEAANPHEHLQKCIENVDRLIGLLERLRDDDSSAYMLAIEGRPHGAFVVYANNHELELDEALKRVNDAVSETAAAYIMDSSAQRRLEVLQAKQELFICCRRSYASCLDIWNTAIPTLDNGDHRQMIRLFRAPGESLDSNTHSNIEVGHRLKPTSGTRVLEKLSDEFYMAALGCKTDAVRDACKICFGIDFDEFIFERVCCVVVLDDGFSFLDFFDAFEADLLKVAVAKSNELEQRQSVELKNWNDALNAEAAKSPRIRMLSNTQLRYLLTSGGSIFDVAAICNPLSEQANLQIPISTRASSIDRLAELSLDWSNTSVSTRASPIDRLADLSLRYSGCFLSVGTTPTTSSSKLVVKNLGLKKSREQVVDCVVNGLVSSGGRVSPSHVFWCSGDHRASDITNFVARVSTLPREDFIIVCPSRLSLLARRELVRQVAQIRKSQGGGSLGVVFDDHAVESALHRALGAEREEILGSDMLASFGALKELNAPAPLKLGVVNGRVGDGKSFYISDLHKKSKAGLVRVGVNEAFSSDSCSRVVMEAMDQANGEPLFVHLDIAGGESIESPSTFFQNANDVDSASHRVHPLEELDRWIFNFIGLGVLQDDRTGRWMRPAPSREQITILVELPGDVVRDEFLRLNLPSVFYLCNLELNVNVSMDIVVPYVAQDADDLFAMWALKAISKKSGAKVDSSFFNIYSLYEARKAWEKRDLDGCGLVTPNDVEAIMPGWTKRRQRFALRLLADRFATLGQFGQFQVLGALYNKRRGDESVKDDMMQVLKTEYHNAGHNYGERTVELEAYDLFGDMDGSFSAETMNSIEAFRAPINEANKILGEHAIRILTSTLHTFAPNVWRQPEEYLVIGGSDEGCSAQVVTPASLGMSGSSSLDSFELNIKSEQGWNDLELRSVVAPALGFLSASGNLHIGMNRLGFVLTPSVAEKLLIQAELRGSRSCVIWSGGTGVGKSEVARVQTELFREAHGCQLACELQSLILKMFGGDNPFDEDNDELFDELTRRFEESCLKFEEGSRRKAVYSTEQVPIGIEAPCLYFWPKTIKGKVPIHISDDSKSQVEIVVAQDPDDIVECVSLSHNAIDCFVFKVKARAPGTFWLNVQCNGKPVTGGCFAIQATESCSWNREANEPRSYLRSPPSAAELCDALGASVDLMANENHRAVMIKEVRILLLKWAQDWIDKHAFVSLVPSRKSVSKLVEIYGSDHRRSFQDIGKLMDSLRRPTLLFKTCLHPSTTVDSIKSLVGRAVSRLTRVIACADVAHEECNHLTATIFFDEMNTSLFPGLLKQLVLDRVLDGKSLAEIGFEYFSSNALEMCEDASDDAFGPSKDEYEYDLEKFKRAAESLFFMGAINPHSEKQLPQFGEATFTVGQFPKALDEVTRSFQEDLTQGVTNLASAMLGKISSLSLAERRDATRLVSLAHRLVAGYRDGYTPVDSLTTRKHTIVLDKTFPSIRNIDRVCKLVEFFVAHPKFLFSEEDERNALSNNDSFEEMAKSPAKYGIEIRRRAILLAIASSYQLQLLKAKDDDSETEIDLRDDFARRMSASFVLEKSWASEVSGYTTTSPANCGIPPAYSNQLGFFQFVKRQIGSIAFGYLKCLVSEEHAPTWPLKEHLFGIFVCMQTKIPILLIGPPGCSKTLAVQLLLKGCKSRDMVSLISTKVGGPPLRMLDESPYQCSETSTATEIDSVFRNAASQAPKEGQTNAVVFLDEGSLAPRALKAIHEHLDHPVVACVINSNLPLDGAKMNRCLVVRRAEFGDTTLDLIELAKASVGWIDDGFEDEHSPELKLLNGFCEGYLAVTRVKELASMFHLRHFLYFVRSLRTTSRARDFKQDACRIAEALARNFGGLPSNEFERYVGVPFFLAIRVKVPSFPSFPPPGWQYDLVSLVNSSIKGAYEYCEDENFDPALYAPRNVLLVNRGDGLRSLESFLTTRACQDMTVSAFPGDDDSVGRGKVVSEIAEQMTKGGLVRLFSGERGRMFSAFYDALNMRFAKTAGKFFVTVAIGSRWMSRPYNPKFRLVVVLDSDVYDKLRAPQSNMHPFLSRFETFFVSSEEVLASPSVDVRLARALNVHADSLKQDLSRVVERIDSFVRDGSGCFVGVDTDQSWDMASAIVLEDVRKREYFNVNEVISCCAESLMSTMRPEALCAIAAGAGEANALSKPLVRRYVEDENDHFSLSRLIRYRMQCLQQRSQDSATTKVLVLTRSFPEFINREALVSSMHFDLNMLGTIFVDESCDTSLKFRDTLTSFHERAHLILIVVNLSFVDMDRFAHIRRMLETFTITNGEHDVIIIAHRPAAEVALDQLPLAAFVQGWRTVFVDDLGGRSSAATQHDVLRCAFRLDDMPPTREVESTEAALMSVFIEASKRVTLEWPLNVRRSRNVLTNLKKCTNPLAMNSLLVSMLKSLMSKCSNTELVRRITDRLAREKLGGYDSQSFEEAVCLAVKCFHEDLACWLLEEIALAGGVETFITAVDGDLATSTSFVRLCNGIIDVTTGLQNAHVQDSSKGFSIEVSPRKPHHLPFFARVASTRNEATLIQYLRVIDEAEAMMQFELDLLELLCGTKSSERAGIVTGVWLSARARGGNVVVDDDQIERVMNMLRFSRSEISIQKECRVVANVSTILDRSMPKLTCEEDKIAFKAEVAKWLFPIFESSEDAPLPRLERFLHVIVSKGMEHIESCVRGADIEPSDLALRALEGATELFRVVRKHPGLVSIARQSLDSKPCISSLCVAAMSISCALVVIDQVSCPTERKLQKLWSTVAGSDALSISLLQCVLDGFSDMATATESPEIIQPRKEYAMLAIAETFASYDGLFFDGTKSCCETCFELINSNRWVHCKGALGVYLLDRIAERAQAGLNKKLETPKFNLALNAATMARDAPLGLKTPIVLNPTLWNQLPAEGEGGPLRLELSASWMLYERANVEFSKAANGTNPESSTFLCKRFAAWAPLKADQATVVRGRNQQIRGYREVQQALILKHAAFEFGRSKLDFFKHTCNECSGTSHKACFVDGESGWQTMTKALISQDASWAMWFVGNLDARAIEWLRESNRNLTIVPLGLQEAFAPRPVGELLPNQPSNNVAIVLHRPIYAWSECTTEEAQRFNRLQLLFSKSHEECVEEFEEIFTEDPSQERLYEIRSMLPYAAYATGLGSRQTAGVLSNLSPRLTALLALTVCEKAWVETLGGSLQHALRAEWPWNARDENASAKHLSAISMPLYFLACKPDSDETAIYLAVLSTALGAPAAQNHIWNRVFNLAQTSNNEYAPFFGPRNDVDCAYDLPPGDLLNHVNSNEMRLAGAVAWASNSLAVALPGQRFQLIDAVRNICRLESDQTTSMGMDPDLVALAGTDELGWRTQYMCIRFVNFLRMSFVNLPNDAPQWKAWPTFAGFGTQVLRLLRHELLLRGDVPGIFIDSVAGQNYEQIFREAVALTNNGVFDLIKSVQSDKHSAEYVRAAMQTVQLGFDLSPFSGSEHENGKARVCLLGKYDVSYQALDALKSRVAPVIEAYEFLVANFDKSSFGTQLVSQALNELALKGGGEAQRINETVFVARTGHYDCLCTLADACFPERNNCQDVRPFSARLTLNDAIGENANTSWLLRTVVDVAGGVNASAGDEDESVAVLTTFNLEELESSAERLPLSYFLTCVRNDVESDAAMKRTIHWNMGNARLRWHVEDLVKSFQWRVPTSSSSSAAAMSMVQPQGEDDESFFDRFGMMDATGKQLAEISGHPSAPEHHLTNTSSSMEHRKRARSAFSIVRHGRPLAFCFAPKLLSRCRGDDVEDLSTINESKFQDALSAVDNAEDRALLADPSRRWDVAWGCVDVLLSRNDRFSYLDVVLQSKRVVAASEWRIKLIKKANPKRTLQTIRRLVGVLGREELLTRFANNPTALVGLAVGPELAEFIPKEMTCASLADFLLLLFDVSSRLRLKMFAASSSTSSDASAFSLELRSYGEVWDMEDRPLHPPGHFRAPAPVDFVEEDTPAAEEKNDVSLIPTLGFFDHARSRVIEGVNVMVFRRNKDKALISLEEEEEEEDEGIVKKEDRREARKSIRQVFATRKHVLGPLFAIAVLFLLVFVWWAFKTRVMRLLPLSLPHPQSMPPPQKAMARRMAGSLSANEIASESSSGFNVINMLLYATALFVMVLTAAVPWLAYQLKLVKDELTR